MRKCSKCNVTPNFLQRVPRYFYIVCPKCGEKTGEIHDSARWNNDDLAQLQQVSKETEELLISEWDNINSRREKEPRFRNSLCGEGQVYAKKSRHFFRSG